MLNLIIKTYDQQKNLLKTKKSSTTPHELFTMFHIYTHTVIPFHEGEYFKAYFINDSLLLVISVDDLIPELNFHAINNQPQLVNYLLNSDKQFSKYLNIIKKLENNDISQNISFDDFVLLEFDVGEFERKRYHYSSYNKAIFDRSISDTHIILYCSPEHYSSHFYCKYRPFCDLSYCLFHSLLPLSDGEYMCSFGIGYHRNESDYFKRFYE